MQNLCLLILSAYIITVYAFPKNYVTKKSHIHVTASNSPDFPPKIVKNFGPLLGFYAVMLAPIYGIGLPFFGSMTDFQTIRNRVSQNEIIVAPRGFTPNARAFDPPIFGCDAQTLESKFDKVIMNQPRITYITTDDSTRRKEYIQRTLIFRFPDVVTFVTIPIDKEKSTLAVHSYSIYGAGDLGVNGNRIRSWIRELAKVAPIIESDDVDIDWLGIN